MKTGAQMLAWAILPDHFHVIIRPGNSTISEIMHDVKLSFGFMYRERARVRSGRIWQNRFWDHIIRHQEDMNRHVDYIHYNPVKHGLVNNPFEWPDSSLHRFVSEGFYSRDWGQSVQPTFEEEFGE